MSVSPLDISRLLRETFIAQVEHYAALGSTNDEAKQRAADGPGALPLLVVADEQTAGRGRGANRWWTGRGGLAASVLLDDQTMGTDCGPGPLVSLAAAVSVAETVIPLLPGRSVGIHWPNDVYGAGRKLGGVLVEVLAGGLSVVGIGLNLNNTIAEGPAELRGRAVSLRDLTGATHDRTSVLIAILRRFAAHLGREQASPGHIGRVADSLCLQQGRTLQIESAERTVRGVCGGIAPDGALMLDTVGGRERIVTGVLRRRNIR